MELRNAQESLFGAEIRPEVQRIVRWISERGLNSAEKTRLINLIDKFLPYDRRPLNEGDTVVWGRFQEVVDVARVASQEEANAIRSAISSARLATGGAVPDCDLKSDFMMLLPQDSTVSPIASDPRPMSDEERMEVARIISHLTLNIIIDNESYEPETIGQIGFFARVINGFTMPFLDDDDTDATVTAQELRRFESEARKFLVSALQKMVV